MMTGITMEGQKVNNFVCLISSSIDSYFKFCQKVKDKKSSPIIGGR